MSAGTPEPVSAVEVQDALSLHPARTVKVGDQVVYYLTDWQRRIEKQKGDQHQYTSDWSLPNLVVDLEGSKVVVRPIGQRKGPLRQVPLRLVRVLQAADQAGERRERQEMQEGRAESTPSSSPTRNKRKKPSEDHEHG
eukprot:GHVS01101584.1.p4 GENE.GHVS01101584.1~~GHVS01101584.1.p4  ORF type:complete len:138 (-),score=21.71 GHVS01101584.1:378-791(-)